MTTFDWDAESGITTCTVFYNNQKFIGKAACAEEDRDFVSPLVGQNIAHYRAKIALMKHRRDNEIKPQIKILYEYYYSLVNPKEPHEFTRELKILMRKINDLKADLNITKEVIYELRMALNDYINQKETFYQAVRLQRSKSDKNA